MSWHGRNIWPDYPADYSDYRDHPWTPTYTQSVVSNHLHLHTLNTSSGNIFERIPLQIAVCLSAQSDKHSCFGQKNVLYQNKSWRQMISVTATNHYDVYYSQSANQLYCHTGHRASSTTKKNLMIWELEVALTDNFGKWQLYEFIICRGGCSYTPPTTLPYTLSQQVFRFLLVAKMIWDDKNIPSLPRLKGGHICRVAPRAFRLSSGNPGP